MHAIRQNARTFQHPHQVLRMRTMDFVSRAAAELREAMLSKIALGRFGTLGEISALACWLASVLIGKYVRFSLPIGERISDGQDCGCDRSEAKRTTRA